MFRLPTPRLLSGLKSALRPAMPRFKVSAFWLLILAWIFLLVWIWWKGPTWTLYEEQWLKPLANRWLATAAWGIIALMWLTVRVMKRLQQLEKMQKQQREEAVDPLSVELNAQQRYLDRWLLRLQRYLDNRRFLWQLPWYMVIGPAGSGKTTLLREGFPSDIIYAPEGARGAEQRLYLTPHVGKQAVIFDIDGTLCAPADADILHRRLQPLETGMQMMRVADSRWPESLQQQQASTQWNEALKTRAQSSPQLRGWLQTRQDLHAFADLVMQREKEGLTLSYIKNVIWQAERGLGQETPVESLLTQYHDARAQKQNTDALEKQINERLEGVLSRWLLLKNNVMPEAATGTTAEK